MLVMLPRELGRTGLTVPPLILGGNVFGWTVDQSTSMEILDRAMAGGLTAIDTANSYSRWVPGNQGGESERIIGEWMASRRNRGEVTLITKVGSGMGEGEKGLSARYIARAVDQSLQRLQTEWIDLYLAHWPDEETPWEETLRAFQQLVEAGKIRAFGACNLSAEQLEASLKVAREHHLIPYQVLQPLYNLLERDRFEGQLRFLALQHELGVIPHSALARGFLTGKYREEADFSRSPRGKGVREYLDPRGRRIIAALDQIAVAHGATPGEIALAWLAAQPGVTAPIVSVSKTVQLQGLIDSTRIILTSGERAILSQASHKESLEGGN